MKVLDKTISTWQTGILIFILLFANKILILPSLLFEGAGAESIFIPAFLFVVEIFVLFLFYKLKTKFPYESFGQIISAYFGNGIKIFIYILFLVFFFGKAVLLYNVTFVFFRNVIYKGYGQLLFLFCFLPIINHLALSGLRVMGRTMQIFFPIILLICVFCITIGLLGIDSNVLFFESSFPQVVSTALRHVAPFGDVIFLFLIMDKIEIKKGKWKVIFSLATLSCILIEAVTVIFVFSYTYTSFMHPYAIFEIMSYVKEYDGLGRIDLVSMVVIIMFAYFHLAIYLKAFMLSYGECLRKWDQIYSVILFDFLFVVISNFFLVSLEQSVVFGEQILPYTIIFAYIVVPCFCILFLILHRKKIKRKRSEAILKDQKGVLMVEGVLDIRFSYAEIPRNKKVVEESESHDKNAVKEAGPKSEELAMEEKL